LGSEQLATDRLTPSIAKTLASGLDLCTTGPDKIVLIPQVSNATVPAVSLPGLQSRVTIPYQALLGVGGCARVRGLLVQYAVAQGGARRWWW